MNVQSACALNTRYLTNLSVSSNKTTNEQEILGRINRLLSFATRWTTQKTTHSTILRRRGNVFTELLPSNDSGIHRQTHRLSFNKTRTVQKMSRLTILLLSRVFVAEGTRLLSRCLAMKGRIHSTNPLPRNDGRDIYTDAESDGRDL
jgi:hypothetical protein